jgi:hypothetical protein
MRYLEIIASEPVGHDLSLDDAGKDSLASESASDRVHNSYNVDNPLSASRINGGGVSIESEGGSFSSGCHRRVASLFLVRPRNVEHASSSWTIALYCCTPSGVA